MRVFLLKTFALFVAALIFPAASFPQAAPSGAERVLFDSANRERQAQGLPALHWEPALAAAARRHAAAMSEHNAIGHQFPGELDFSLRAAEAGALFSALAENVAVGPDAETIQGAWMASPPHRRNLLDPDLDSLGIAVVQGKGQLFAVEDFSRAVHALSIEDQEEIVGKQLRAKGLRLLPDDGDARRACAQGTAYQTSRRPQYVLRYSASALNNLPPELQQKIRTERYHAAAVGACPGHDEKGFANYQLAVILFE